MRGRKSTHLRIISAIIIVFFAWTFCGLYDIAYAIDTPSATTKPSPKAQRPEARFQKAIEDIENTINDPSTSTDTKKAKLKIKKSEIDAIDTEIKNQFAETEKKFKDANLPDKILQRHYKFVKHYEDNLAELKANLDDIDKAKTDDEHKTAIEKTKAHLAKVKPQKKLTPLDPNKLPHRSAEPVYKEPRTKPEEFMKDLQANPPQSPLGKVGSDYLIVASMGSLSGLLSITATTGAIPAPTSADLAETVEVKFTNAIMAKAAELNHQPLKIYEWVRNNVEYVPTYGSIQGADMCLQTMQCNDMDTASLLIALLRVSGVHSRYVYGTIEVPIEKFMNWTGGFTNASAALDFAASGGIPITGVIQGGTIKAARLEHVWVDAWVDYIPNRGAKHKKGDTWIQLDGSYKQYTYTHGMDLRSAVSFDWQLFASQLIANSTINEAEGYVTSVNSTFIQQTMTDYQSQVQSYISANFANATVGDMLGKKEVVKHEFPYLMGTLMYKSNLGYRASELPDSLRHKIGFSVISGGYEDIAGDPLFITKSLPEISGKKITLSYSPATPDDEMIINSYLPAPHADGTPIQPSELPTSLPAYLIALVPELRIDGVVVATGSAVGMGTIEKFDMTFIDPARGNDVVSNKITAGEYWGIAVDASNVSQKQMLDIKNKLNSTITKMQTNNFTGLTKDDILGDLLYTVAMTYNAEMNLNDSIQARIIGVASVRFTSEAVFKTSLGVDMLFGVPVSANVAGFTMDVDRNLNLVKAFDGDKEKKLRFLKVAGLKSSALEHSVPEQLFSTPENPVQGVSAVKALQIANNQGIPIYTITQSNIDTIIPQLQLDSVVINEIKNVVNAGKDVTISKTDIYFNGWTGVGYIVLDPATGDGAFMISGGESGAVILIGGIVGGAVILSWMITSGFEDEMLLGMLTQSEMATAKGYGNQSSDCAHYNEYYLRLICAAFPDCLWANIVRYGLKQRYLEKSTSLEWFTKDHLQWFIYAALIYLDAPEEERNCL